MDDISKTDPKRTALGEPLFAEFKTKQEDHPDSTNDDSHHSTKKRGHAHSLWQRFRAGTIHNQLTVVFTGLVFAATALYAGFSGWQLVVMKKQLKEIQNSSTDTHTLAVAADTQSKQAIQQTDKMEKSLTKTDNLIRATSDLAKEARRSADASQSALDAARKNLTLAERSLHIQERPYIGVKRTIMSGVDTGDFKASLELANAGKTPALDFQFRTFIVLTASTLPDNPAEPQLASKGSVSILLGGDSIQTGEVHIDTSDVFADINAGKLFVYVFGRMSYKDVFKCGHEGRFCYVYLPKFKNFTTCPNNNFEMEEVCR